MVAEPGCRGSGCPDSSCDVCLAVPEKDWRAWKRQERARIRRISLGREASRSPPSVLAVKIGMLGGRGRALRKEGRYGGK